MAQPLRVLIVEDSEEDATLLLQELRAGSYDPIFERVEAAEAMKAALHKQSWDLVISDYFMPDFSGLEALKLLQESGLDPPFIIVSGKIGEMTAIEAMKAGADDYVLKYNLTRLIPVIQRALQEATVRQEKKQAEQAFRESEERYRNLIESSHDLIQSVAPDGRFLYVNRAWMDTLGYTPDELPNLKLFDLIHPDFQQHCQVLLKGVIAGESAENIQVTFRAKDGRPIVLEGNATPCVMEGKVVAIQCFLRDITERRQAEQRIQRDSETQTVVNSLLRHSLANVPLDELLGYALDLVLSIPWLSFQSRGCIFLADDTPGVLVMKAQSGLDEQIRRSCGLVSFGRCLCGRAALEKEIQFADHLDEAHEIRYEGISQHGHYCVPILSASRVLGVINLYLQPGHPRSEREEAFLRATADALAGIIDRKRAEEALRHSEQNFRALAESSALAIFIYQRKFRYVNPAAQVLTGYSPEESLAMDFWDLIHPDFRELVKERGLARLRGEAVSNRYEFKILTKAGEERWVDFTAGMVEFEGQPAAMGTAYDITERKQSEQALRQSEERHRAIMEQSADGIYLLDGDTKCILEVNRAFAQMLGYTLEEMPGLSMYDFNAADREEMDRRFQGLLRGEAPPLIERQFRRKDGSLLPVWLSANLIFFGEKKVVSTLVRDLTEKKAMEAQFLRAQRMESIGLLAGGIAHDLNNILTPILINTDLLTRVFPEQGKQMLSSIAASAQRGSEIVKQILTFARGMEGEHLFLSPKHLLKEMEGFLRETFPKSITLETEIGKDLWSLQGDPTQLHQVLMNLCLNAKDAMEKGGKLTLSAENLSLDEAYAGMHPSAQVGPYLLFTVADTGKGIPSEHLDRIFDPFFTTKERGAGTGLGLSTVHGIVKGHGGFLNVYSELGRGTQFRVYLPASPSAEMAQAEKERAPLPSGKGELLLVVEDEVSIREITQAALEACGYSVMAACDGSEAVALYAQHGKEIQVVITDMAMPIMDGAATIRALQKMNPEVKVIATTGMDADKVVSEMNRKVVKAFLQKPFTAERLLRTVGEVLKGGGQ